MGRCHFLTGCVLFWEMDPVFCGSERVNPLCYGREKIKPVYVVPVGICCLVVGKKEKPTVMVPVGSCRLVVVKKKKPTASCRRLRWLGSIVTDIYKYIYIYIYIHLHK